MGLKDLCVQASRIDAGQHLARLNHLTFFEEHGDELTIHLGTNNRRVECGERAQGLDPLAHVHAFDLARTHGLSATFAARAALTTLSTRPTLTTRSTRST